MDSLFTIIQSKQSVKKKAPAYEWQDLALKIMNELSIPNFKRGSVFKACKEHSKIEIERALNDTKELCKKGEQWKYFFKVLTATNNKNPDRQINQFTTGPSA